MEEGEGAGDEEVGGLKPRTAAALHGARATAQQLAVRRSRVRTLHPPMCGHRHARTHAGQRVRAVRSTCAGRATPK
jgi:hypothetical protein